MNLISKPKGTYDLYGKESRDVLFLQNLIETLMESYNYEMIRTPLFESSELFHRGVGETTDIVTKETYDFKDRGDRNLTLRPEGTAGVARCFIENKLYTKQPQKFWYFGSMYRYERPQSGRFREHYQFGCELYGSFDPLSDAEIISIPYTLLKSLGLNVTVYINSLGESDSRKSYRDALIKYLEPNIDKLCDDCKSRFLKNPLRILDCKVDSDNEILKNVPSITDYLTKEDKTYFDEVLKYLKVLNIPYEISPKTVRGLDYYTHTVFEIKDNLSGVTLCGGGRYNNLIEELNGPKTPAVGFGMGSERLLKTLEEQDLSFNLNNYLDCFIIPVSNNEKSEALSLTYFLRMMGLKCEIDLLEKNVKNNFKQALKLNAKFCIVVGEEELKNHGFTVKNMRTSESLFVDDKMIFDYLVERLQEENEESDACSCGENGCSCNDNCNCDDECTCGENCSCHRKENV